MGYDVTFHPISREEVNHYVNDVIKDSNNLERRITWLSKDKEDQDFLRESLYPKLIEAFKNDALELPNVIGFGAAAIAGYLHPYWYNRGGAISFVAEHVPEFKELVTPISQLFGKNGGVFFTENYSATCWIGPEKLPALVSLLKSRKKSIVSPRNEYLGSEGREALLNAIEYAQTHNLGLIEATDIFEPTSGQIVAKPNHLRAKYLKNLKDKTNTRKVLLSPKTAKELLKSIKENNSLLLSGKLSYQINEEWIPELPIDAIQALAEYSIDSMPSLAKSIHTPVNVLKNLFYNSSIKVNAGVFGVIENILAYLVLCNSACPVEILREVASKSQTSNLDIQELVIRHPNVPQDIIELFLSHKKPFIRALAHCRVKKEYLDPIYMHALGIKSFYPEIQNWETRENIWAGKKKGKKVLI